jgi:hypothetical protein
MKLTVKSKVDSEGKLSLQLPQQLANKELEIIISELSLDHAKMPTPEDLGYPTDFFEKTAGQWQGEILVRETQDNCDQRIWDISS